MATSAADFGDHQTKPNQIMHNYPYMIYLFENTRPRTLHYIGLLNLNELYTVHGLGFSKRYIM